MLVDTTLEQHMAVVAAAAEEYACFVTELSLKGRASQGQPVEFRLRPFSRRRFGEA